LEENWEKDQNKVLNQKICLKCDKYFISTKEFAPTPENNFDFLSFNFCDECRSSVNIDDYPTAFACWMSTWCGEYIKNNEENKGSD